jgi:hypothetical protein
MELAASFGAKIVHNFKAAQAAETWGKRGRSDVDSGQWLRI